MAGRASVVLREQFEAAQRGAEAHGSIAGIVEVRVRVDEAIGAIRDRLRLIQVTEPVGSAMLAEKRRLEDELDELKRLRDHIKYLMGVRTMKGLK